MDGRIPMKKMLISCVCVCVSLFTCNAWAAEEKNTEARHISEFVPKATAKILKERVNLPLEQSSDSYLAAFNRKVEARNRTEGTKIRDCVFRKLLDDEYQEQQLRSEGVDFDSDSDETLERAHIRIMFKMFADCLQEGNHVIR